MGQRAGGNGLGRFQHRGQHPGGYGYTPITISAGGQFGMWGRPTSSGNTPVVAAGSGPILYNNVTLNGGGIGGTQVDTYSPQTYAGTINLTANSQILAATPSNTSQRCTDTYFTGAITGTGSLTKPATFTQGGATVQDGGTMYFTGSASNTYNGDTSVYAGTLNLQKTGGAIAIPGNLNIGDAGSTGWDVVNLGGNGEIASTGVVTFNGAASNWAYLNMMGYNQTVGGIKDASGYSIIQIVDTTPAVNSNSTLTVNNAADCSYNGAIPRQVHDQHRHRRAIASQERRRQADPIGFQRRRRQHLYRRHHDPGRNNRRRRRPPTGRGCQWRDP